MKNVKNEQKKCLKNKIKRFFFWYFATRQERENASLPNNGIASDTCGNVSATKLRNTVSDRRIVTPIK